MLTRLLPAVTGVSSWLVTCAAIAETTSRFGHYNAESHTVMGKPMSRIENAVDRVLRAVSVTLLVACLVFMAIFTWKSFDLFLSADDLSPHFP